MAISTATVKAFCNTGFDLNNIPDNPSLLNTAATSVVTLETLNCLPLSGKNTGSITVKTFAQLPQVDYMSLYFPQDGTTYYVTNIQYEYISLDTVKIDFTVDAWLTAGGLANISKISGLTKRHHVSDDTFGKYTMPDELLVPTKPMKCACSPVNEPLGDSYTNDFVIVVATIDLFKLGEVDANGDYVWAPDAGIDYTSDENVCCVPTVPSITSAMEPDLKVSNATGASPGATVHMPACAYFNGNNDTVQRGIAMARSLGIEDAILYQYTIPANYIYEVTYYYDSQEPTRYGQSVFKTIKSWYGMAAIAKGGVTDLDLEYDTVMNKRVLTGDINAYHFVAIATGEELKVNPEDWDATAGGNLSIMPCIDPRPTGKPIYKPLLKNTPSYGFVSAVRGEQWAATPIKFETVSGIDLTVQKFNNTRYGEALDFQISQEKATLNQSTGFIENAVRGDVIGGTLGVAKSQMNMELDALSYQGSRAIEKAAFYMDNMIVAPQLNFPRSETIRDAVGNGFVLWRNYLDPDDVDRLDVILNMYGYKDVKKLEKSDFTNRRYYNYVEAGDVKISYTNAVNKRIVELAESQVEAGVRVWHRKPDTALFNQTNPVSS